MWEFSAHKTSSALRLLIRVSQHPNLLILSIGFLSLSLYLLFVFCFLCTFPLLLIQTLSFCLRGYLSKPQALVKD